MSPHESMIVMRLYELSVWVHSCLYESHKSPVVSLSLMSLMSPQ